MNLLNPLLSKTTGPRVAGTILKREFLESLAAGGTAAMAGLPCDLIELRVDGYPDYTGWSAIAVQLEQVGLPVLMTLRLAKEGGFWKGADRERLAAYQLAIQKVSGVDVELESELAKEIGALARAEGKTAVISYHNFQETPAQKDLERTIERMREIGTVAKIAVKVNQLDEVEMLRGLLHHNWGVPVCILGMGPLGRETRLRFPLEGSCITYGYLDEPGAPGQYSAKELREYFRQLAPN